MYLTDFGYQKTYHNIQLLAIYGFCPKSISKSMYGIYNRESRRLTLTNDALAMPYFFYFKFKANLSDL